MATVRELIGKKGISYQLQVKIKDTFNNTYVRKSKTIVPSKVMSKNMLEKWLEEEKEKFERQVENEIAVSGSDNAVTAKTTLNEYCKLWLKSKEHIHALNTQIHYKETFEVMEDTIGKVILKNITTRHVKEFFVKLDSLKKLVGKAIAKTASLEKVMERTKITTTDIANKTGLSARIIKSLMSGVEIPVQSAMRIAKVLGVRAEQVFDITATEQPYAYDTIAKHRRNIKTVLNGAIQDGILTSDIANIRFTSTIPRKAKTLNYYSDDELKELIGHINKCKSITQKLGLTLLVYTGMRRSEVSGLDWADIDTKNHYISVNKAYVTVKGHGTIMKETKTLGSMRDITISKNLEILIEEYREYYNRQRARLGEMWSNDNALLVNDLGKRIYPQTYDKWLKSIIKENGMRALSVHGLRHTHITLLLLNNVPMVTVSQRAGHSKTSTTMDIYAHVTARANREAVDIFDKVME